MFITGVTQCLFLLFSCVGLGFMVLGQDSIVLEPSCTPPGSARRVLQQPFVLAVQEQTLPGRSQQSVIGMQVRVEGIDFFVSVTASSHAAPMCRSFMTFPSLARASHLFTIY